MELNRKVVQKPKPGVVKKTVVAPTKPITDPTLPVTEPTPATAPANSDTVTTSGSGLGLITSAVSQSSSSPVNLHTDGTPNKLTAVASVPATITADQPAIFALEPGSAGTLTVTSATTAVYTPPTGLAAANQVGGCPVAPNDSIYNTRIDSLPIHPQSAQWINQSLALYSQALSIAPEWGVNVLDSSAAITQNPTFHYSTILNGIPFLFAPKPVRLRELGSLTTDGNNDHHMVSVNHQTCQFWESYNDNVTNLWTAASGYTYYGDSYAQPASSDGGGGTTDAAGLPLTPLMARFSELESGAILHALRFSSCAGCISSQYLWPATYSTGTAASAAPMGSRWRLKSSFNISTFSAKAQIFLRALQQYGMILADVGTMQVASVDDDVLLDPAVASALLEIQTAHIDQSNFDIVDESSLMVSTTSHRSHQSSYPTAVLDATTQSGTKVSVPIALLPAMIGTAVNTTVVQSGASLHFAPWVTGVANQTVLCSASAGTMQNCVYTAPPVATPTSAVITMQALADSTVTRTIPIMIIPAGAIRLHIGSDQPYTDSHGNMWMADSIGVLTGAYSNQNDWYPASNWIGIQDAPLYQTWKYTWGDDITYQFAVPNGNYSVTFGFSHNGCSGAYNPLAVYDTGLTNGPVVLEVNGADTTFDVGAAESYTCRKPATTSMSTSVTNGILAVSLRSTGNSTTQSAPSLNNLSILPQ